MHVYLKDGNQRRWITDVYLLKGYCPCIGGEVSTKTLSEALRMEPAIWCKVLFLESVSVDCNQRMICWTTSNSPNSEDGKGSPNQYSINDECSGYDAEDELFDLARTIINRSNIEDGIQDPVGDDYELDILRMLHCFILPKITLHVGDLDKVLQAKERQGQHIQALDRKVIEQCVILDECQGKLDDLRDHLLPNIEQIAPQCSKQFLDYLLADVNKEERKLRDLLDRTQDEVEALKIQLSGGSADPCDLEPRLQQARTKRESLVAKLMAVVTAREDLADAEPLVNNNDITTNNPDVLEYMETKRGLQRIKNDRNMFLEQKNCALSVREMLDGILKDLRNQGYSEANDADSKGTRATDVLQGVWYPEWQKLGERVATIVNNDDHPVGINFQSFCAGIRQTCQELIQLDKRNSQSSPASSSEYSPFDELQNGEGFAESNAEMFGLQDFLVDSYREKLKCLRARLFNHFTNVTELLSETFNNRDYQFKNRLRLAYEQCFFEQEGSFVECVYELAHHEHVARLESDIKRLKKLPIKLLNLPMKDEWWLDVFEQRVRIGSLSVHVVKTNSYEEHHGMNGIDRQGSRPIDIGGSYEIIDELDDDFPHVTQETLKSFSDTASVRSFFINAVRTRSRTFNFDGSSSSSDDDSDDDYVDCGKTNQIKYSASAPELKFSLHDLIHNWETRGLKRTSLQKHRRSKSYTNISMSKISHPDTPTDEGPLADTFEDHFGPALQNICDILKAKSPMAKLKCLTASLRKITAKVAELRLREGGDQFSVAVTAEDLLPLLILMMLQMEPYEAAVLWPQLAMTEDLMAPFLSSGCHGWALVEFQMAQRILSDLCTQF